MEQYLTSEQVAKLLQVHQFTVLKYLRSGKIKGVKIGRVYRIKESEVENFLGEASVVEEPVEEPAPTIKPVIEPAHEVKFEDDEKADAKEYYTMI